jgi:hypothetical protein
VARGQDRDNAGDMKKEANALQRASLGPDDDIEVWEVHGGKWTCVTIKYKDLGQRRRNALVG